MVHVPVPLLGGSPQVEVWRSGYPVRTGRQGPISYAESNDLLLAHLQVIEGAKQALGELILGAYRLLLSFSVTEGYSQVVRVWNVVPRLNDGEGDSEGYKQFCVGRSCAFDEFLAPGARPPAASCVGTASNQIVVYLLASRRPAVPLENPRQVRADLYPRVYGPRRPSFSRALLQIWRDEMQLHVSGTASIVGHATVYPEDPDRQIEETVRNLLAVLRRAATESRRPAPRLDECSSLRVYIRHEQHFDRIRAAVARLVGGTVPVIFLRADICRRPLVVEVEGSWCTTRS